MIKFPVPKSAASIHPTSTTDVQIGRRKFLAFAAAGTAIAACATIPVAAASTSINSGSPRKLRLYNTHTREKLSVTFWSNGHYLREGLDQLNHHLRDHRQNESTDMDPRLFDQLWLLQENTGSTGRFEVISGYRTPRTNAGLRKKSSGVARKSYHMQGRAIDVRLSDVPLKTACATARKLKLGGVGYYRNSNFIHLDTGPVRTWAS
ncbi:MAG: DUF882 domain-containing protein [Granulosicoccus sp.]|nr:DUF882 domain-containing protein [Granulosicoccus sp.]